MMPKSWKMIKKRHTIIKKIYKMNPKRWKTTTNSSNMTKKRQWSKNRDNINPKVDTKWPKTMSQPHLLLLLLCVSFHLGFLYRRSGGAFYLPVPRGLLSHNPSMITWWADFFTALILRHFIGFYFIWVYYMIQYLLSVCYSEYCSILRGMLICFFFLRVRQENQHHSHSESQEVISLAYHKDWTLGERAFHQTFYLTLKMNVKSVFPNILKCSFYIWSIVYANRRV